MVAKPTHMLILEVSAGSQVVPIEISRGTLKTMMTAYKKWKAKIEAQKLIDIPADLPASVGTSTILSLRVTTMPDYVTKADKLNKKWAGDPKRAKYMQQFIGNAQTVEQQAEEGIDLLDQGYKSE